LCIKVHRLGKEGSGACLHRRKWPPPRPATPAAAVRFPAAGIVPDALPEQIRNIWFVSTTRILKLIR
jgi:hypothetical protein